MFKIPVLSAAISASLMLIPVERAAADSGLVGGIVGGIIGGAIVNEANKNKRTRTRTVTRTQTCGPKCRANIAARSQNREMQTSLNYFGYGAGSPDGVVGRGTRAAVARFQASMGYPATGYIQEHERAFLVSSYHRGTASGQPGSPQLLASFRQQNQAGVMALAPVVPQVQPQQQLVTAPQQPAVQAPTTQVVVNTQPEGTDVQINGNAAQQGLNALNFLGTPAEVSMANHCNRTSLVTNTNGGFVNVSNLSDPNFAMDEQFCLARTYIINESEQMLAAAQGVNITQIQAQCEAFAPAMRPFINAIGAKTVAASTADLQNFVAETGMNPVALAANSKVCLGLGYRIDNTEVALASAMVLVGLGESTYGEMLGHHLLNGFGTASRTDRAVNWYMTAISALETGGTPIANPGNDQRPILLKAAATQLGGGAGTMTAPVTPAAALGAFQMPVVSDK